MTESPDSYWDRIGGQILEELDRRLGTSDAEDLPGTLLMRLAEQYLKYLEKRAKESEENDGSYMTALEAIDQEGLPDETKKQILTDYIGKLEEDLAACRARLEEL
jgi:hypothetical protein